MSLNALEGVMHGYSLEMTARDIDALHAAAQVIPAGTRINITFLGTETAEDRICAAQAVLELGFVPVPHIAARRLGSQEQLEEFLSALQLINASAQLFLIGGDPTEPEGPFTSALDIIETGVLKRFGVESVGIAGYPEGHPDIPKEVLWTHLERKARVLESQGLETEIVTQFAFDAAPVVDWIAEVRKRGITAQIRIGIPGPAGIKRLLSFAKRFGIGANAMIVKKYGFSLTNLMGTAGPDKFVDALDDDLAHEGIARGVSAHMYAFGGLAATAEWAANR